MRSIRSVLAIAIAVVALGVHAPVVSASPQPIAAHLDVAECPGPGDITFPARNVGYGAIVFSGDRVYRFSLNGNVDLAYFEALLATVTFDPEHALDP